EYLSPPFPKAWHSKPTKARIAIKRETMEQIWLQNLDEVQKVEDWVRMRAGGAQSRAVVVFGSARVSASSQSYIEALGMSAELARRGYFIVTGGGYGIMEAANRGAKDGGALSVGLNISLPHEEIPNAYLDVSVQFHDFWLRKMFFEHIASAFVLFAGGFGTLDELFDVLVLIQTQKRTRRPIVLFGKEFWTPLVRFFEQSLLAHSCIERGELELVKIVENRSELLSILLGESRESAGNAR
ncbi:MAG: TIGR00730 family Rossman fold protein, partial [Helicobacter sp.]|nr:TIGR00730 family Rossman fold protein [Helicobacter sp.]